MKPEQAAALRVPFPDSAIGQIPKGGTKLDYVGHAAVTDRLIHEDPDWTWEPFALDADGGPLIRYGPKVATMWIRLTIHGVTRPEVGSVEVGKTDIEKELVSDALRRAAMRFGVALDLWSKEDFSSVPAPPTVVPADAEWIGNRLKDIGEKLGGYPHPWIVAKLPTLRNIATLPVDRLDEAVRILDLAEVEAARA